MEIPTDKYIERKREKDAANLRVTPLQNGSYHRSLYRVSVASATKEVAYQVTGTQEKAEADFARPKGIRFLSLFCISAL